MILKWKGETNDVKYWNESGWGCLYACLGREIHRMNK